MLDYRMIHSSPNACLGWLVNRKAEEGEVCCEEKWGKAKPWWNQGRLGFRVSEWLCGQPSSNLGSGCSAFPIFEDSTKFGTSSGLCIYIYNYIIILFALSVESTDRLSSCSSSLLQIISCLIWSFFGLGVGWNRACPAPAQDCRKCCKSLVHWMGQIVQGAKACRTDKAWWQNSALFGALKG